MLRELLHFRSDLVHQSQDLSGMSVEATDGRLGKVVDVVETGAGTFLVVDTGPWILGRQLTLPAGIVTAIDRDGENVVIDRSKDELKNAPDVDLEAPGDGSARAAIIEYFGGERSARMEPGVREPGFATMSQDVEPITSSRPSFDSSASAPD